MTPASFRFRLIHRLLPLILFTGMLVLVGWLGVEIVRVLAIAFEVIFVFLLVFWMFLLVLSVASGYLWLYCWTYRLEFGDTNLQTRTIHRPIFDLFLPSSGYAPTIRPFSCRYDDIVRIQRAERHGVLGIVLRNGKTIRIAVGWFEDGRTRLLEELFKRFSVGQIEPGLATSLWKRTRADRLRIVSVIPVLLVFGIFTILPIAAVIARGRTGWYSATRVNPLSVTVFSLDSDGSPWFIARTDTGSRYRVYHVSDASTRMWELPNWATGRGYFGGPIGVGGDVTGAPWVISPTQMLHWTGAEWELVSFPGGEIQNRDDKTAVAGSNLWALALSAEGTGEVFWNIDFASGESRVVPLPDAAVQAGLSIQRFHVLPDGALLVFAGSHGDAQEACYLLRNGRWQEPGYPAQWPSSGILQDLTMDLRGQIWVLFGAYEEDRMIGNVLGRLDPQSMVWTWWRPGPGNDWDYWSMEVDAHERVWLTDWDDSLAIFQLTSDGQLQEIRRYTPENSNYEYGTLRLGPDGRMWSAGERLVWMDSNAPTLPEPLPDWMVFVMSESARMKWVILLYAMLGVYKILTWRLQRY